MKHFAIPIVYIYLRATEAPAMDAPFLTHGYNVGCLGDLYDRQNVKNTDAEFDPLPCGSIPYSARSIV